MAICTSDLVRPLCAIENDFLEVLISSFSLRRTPLGVLLSLQFGETADTIWNSLGRTELRDRLPRSEFERKAVEIQSVLDAFFAGQRGTTHDHADPLFPFRYGSGGVLPVVRFRGKDYVCLVYRECFPVGWNIFNGGTDSRTEMLSPLTTAAREFREELLIVDLGDQRRYVHAMESSDPEDMPEHVQARRLWTQRLVLPVDINDFSPLPLPIQWLGGPDAIEVTIGGGPARQSRGCYLNINATDFGIEVDRIARIAVGDHAVFLDGELGGDSLVGAPIGLFELGRLQREAAGASPAAEFRPDVYFFDGMEHSDPDDLLPLLHHEYVPRVQAAIPAWNAQAEWFEHAPKLSLCPVTRTLLRRLPVLDPASGDRPCEVFVSFAAEDIGLARSVTDFIEKHTHRDVFFSPNLRRSYFGSEIHRALESANCLVAVGSRLEYLRKQWVKYEHEAFHLLRMRDPGSAANLVPYVAGLDPKGLPLPLAAYHAIEHDPSSPDTSMGELLRYVGSPCPEAGD